MDTRCLLFPCKRHLEDAVFARQRANFSALTSLLQRSCVRATSRPWSQVLMAVKRSETKVASTRPSREGRDWLETVAMAVAATVAIQLQGGWYLPAPGGSERAFLLAGVRLNMSLWYGSRPLDSTVREAWCPPAGISSQPVPSLRLCSDSFLAST